ncbi:hypothetical protein ACF1G5_20260 [Streptomyces coeruleorubidus]|uniref:hypothetical protein n=1 Tax=Streptomyces coeruleorubidus TaxID=116188 RepID=UPI0036F5ABAE
MPRTSQVTWSGVDELVRAWQSRPQLYPLQRHVVRHVEVAMLAMIPSLRDDIADSVFRWLTLDPDPVAIELPGVMGGPDARGTLERLSVKPDGPASWGNAEAAQSVLFDRWSEGMSY